MNDLLRAAEIFTKEANRTADLIAARDALEKVGSLQQAADEAESRIKKVKAEEKAAQDALVAAQAELAKVKKHTDDLLAETEQYVSSHAARAQADAKKVVGDAQAQAKAEADKARTVIKQLQADQAAERQKLAELRDQREAAQRDLDAVNQERARLKARL